jgi:CheY-like chemotaxis protein
MADPGQLQQVIMNLITNAAEALGDNGGVIALSTGVDEFNDEYMGRSRLTEKSPAGRYSFFEITDTGCGMDEDTLQRLFDPFFTTKFTGRGLGLSAVLGIVRGHKGAILIDSTPGRGTSVRVLFPVCSSDHGAASEVISVPRKEPPAAPLSRTILVVDDDEAVLRLGCEFIRYLGFRSIGATNGEEAVTLFEKYSDEIVVVLLDQTMPKMDGLSTFRELKRLRPDVRVILSSGFDVQDASQRFSGEGFMGFIQKPYVLKELQEKIDRVLTNSD